MSTFSTYQNYQQAIDNNPYARIQDIIKLYQQQHNYHNVRVSLTDASDMLDMESVGSLLWKLDREVPIGGTLATNTMQYFRCHPDYVVTLKALGLMLNDLSQYNDQGYEEDRFYMISPTYNDLLIGPFENVNDLHDHANHYGISNHVIRKSEDVVRMLDTRLIVKHLETINLECRNGHLNTVPDFMTLYVSMGENIVDRLVTVDGMIYHSNDAVTLEEYIAEMQQHYVTITPYTRVITANNDPLYVSSSRAYKEAYPDYNGIKYQIVIPNTVNVGYTYPVQNKFNRYGQYLVTNEPLHSVIYYTLDAAVKDWKAYHPNGYIVTSDYADKLTYDNYQLDSSDYGVKVSPGDTV